MIWEVLRFAGLAVLVTMTMAAVDYAHAGYSLAMIEHRKDPRKDLRWWHRPLHVAARWSVAQWGAAAVGFVVAVRVSMWLLPFEGLGLYLGTTWGGTRVARSEVVKS